MSAIVAFRLPDVRVREHQLFNTAMLGKPGKQLLVFPMVLIAVPLTSGNLGKWEKLEWGLFLAHGRDDQRVDRKLPKDGGGFAEFH
ncbi:hypothetical protein [Roseibium sp. SCP14]|uniref:hypothetical protein n=1 Tax=Roseibium sp. SCP14 TaxID=3141375 RepID=UPI0033364A2A